MQNFHYMQSYAKLANLYAHDVRKWIIQPDALTPSLHLQDLLELFLLTYTDNQIGPFCPRLYMFSPETPYMPINPPTQWTWVAKVVSPSGNPVECWGCLLVLAISYVD